LSAPSTKLQPKKPEKYGALSNDLNYKLLVKLISTKPGLNVTHYRDNFMRRRLDLKMKEKKIQKLSEYVSLIKRDPEEFDELLRYITINYTSFYRDTDVFDYFKRSSLPELFSKERNVKILSAGCSSGEEPYTLAILMKEYCDLNRKPYGKIYAVDVDKSILAKAKKGQYNLETLKKLDEKLLKKYFKVVDKKYQVSQEIKKLVQFSRHDITKEYITKGFDIVLCRNVFIYFTNEAKEKILNNFHGNIKKEGYLFMGKTESLPHTLRDKYKSISNRLKIFRKL